MELIDINLLIKERWCGPGYIDVLLENYSEEEVQIYLAIKSEKLTVSSVAKLTGYSQQEVNAIVQRIYSEVEEEKKDEGFNFSDLGWADSTRKIQNK